MCVIGGKGWEEDEPEQRCDKTEHRENNNKIK